MAFVVDFTTYYRSLHFIIKLFIKLPIYPITKLLLSLPVTLFVAAAFILLRSFLLLLLILPPPSELLLLLVLTRFLILISDLFLELLPPNARTSLDVDETLAKVASQGDVSSLAMQMQNDIIEITYWQF